jgi:RecJ-like exonuclease
MPIDGAKRVPCACCNGIGTVWVYTHCPLCESSDINTHYEGDIAVQHCGSCHLTLPRMKNTINHKGEEVK